MEKLREKVNEALVVYNDYTKSQSTETWNEQEGSSKAPAKEEGEAAKSS